MHSNCEVVYFTVITCSPLSTISNGNTGCDDEANYGSQCTFTCNVGYELKGSESAVCDSQGWWNFNEDKVMPRCDSKYSYVMTFDT